MIQGYALTKNQRDVLFEVNLNAKLLLNNAPLQMAHDTYFSEAFTRKYDEVKEEVRKDKYVIYGITKKQNQKKGTHESLVYYQTHFVGSHPVLAVSDDDKRTLAQNAGYLLALAENTLTEKEKTNHYQIFEEKDKATAVYFSEESTEMKVLAGKLARMDKPVSLYVFSGVHACDCETCFEKIPNVTLKTMPDTILEVYKNIYHSKPA